MLKSEYYGEVKGADLDQVQIRGLFEFFGKMKYEVGSALTITSPLIISQFGCVEKDGERPPRSPENLNTLKAGVYFLTYDLEQAEIYTLRLQGEDTLLANPERYLTSPKEVRRVMEERRAEADAKEQERRRSLPYSLTASRPVR